MQSDVPRIDIQRGTIAILEVGLSCCVGGVVVAARQTDVEALLY
jgi:hypothetical protein